MKSQTMPVLIVLAGGLGTRLKSVVSDQPKILAPIGEHPYLYHLLSWAESKGVSHVHLCLGYLAKQVIDWVQDFNSSLKITWQVEGRQLGTGGAVREALSHFDICYYNEVLVCNGDTFIDFNMPEFLHLSRMSGGGMLTTLVEDSARYGTVKKDEYNNLNQLIEKSGLHQSGEVNAGWYYFSLPHINRLKKSKAVSLEKDYLMDSNTLPITCVCKGENFLDFGTPDSYKVAQSLFKEHI
ncbi:sugar phosphate nucleotidyltransferase [Marinomonas balearica]|uniref:Mannose-1-phosphate guanylyltransferase/D-glycero-alpha-D-manno-heptose 1-phosphate guanylyltransferase n=1 Tax=Marinomonas balearica TaxID=491947 RepID=A0A4V3CG40_9GAMM|nr:sugar phosphate nucleotidyltransferase [Marinomonas balearica]TDO96252.1 mannose-1-phosphate guanylyltransferase/D-glycero-alpha-D-manno-heptose 1-phosphate guanylyltransferase [Marinomonas balearica]